MKHLILLHLLLLTQLALAQVPNTGGFPDVAHGGLFAWTGANYVNSDSLQACSFFMDKPFQVPGTLNKVYFYSNSTATATVQFIVVRLQPGAITTVNLVASETISYNGLSSSSPNGNHTVIFGSTVNILPGDILGVCETVSIIPYAIGPSSNIIDHVYQYFGFYEFPFSVPFTFSDLYDVAPREYPCYADVMYSESAVGYPVAFYGDHTDGISPTCNFFTSSPFPSNSIPDTFSFFITTIPSFFTISVVNPLETVLASVNLTGTVAVGFNTVQFTQFTTNATVSYSSAFIGMCSPNVFPYSSGNTGTLYNMIQYDDAPFFLPVGSTNVLSTAYQLSGRSYAIGATYKCLAGFYQTSSGNCVTCPAGSSCSDGLRLNLCKAGSYQSHTQSTGCLYCSAGTFQANSGQTICGNCPANTYTPHTNSTSCLNCPVGTKSSSGAGVCTPIPPTTTTCNWYWPDATCWNSPPSQSYIWAGYLLYSVLLLILICIIAFVLWRICLSRSRDGFQAMASEDKGRFDASKL